MKKGFTLVELLAVIVILAVLALITTPILLNVIESSRKSTALNSAEGYVRAVSNYLIMNELSDGLYSVLDNNIKAEYTGTGPSNGSITIKKGNVESANLCINKYSIDYVDGVSSISENDYCKDTNNKTLVLNKNGKQLKSIYVGGNTNISINPNDIDMNDVRNMSCNNGVGLTEENGNILINNILGNANCYLNNTLKDAIYNADTTENNILLLEDEENVAVGIENNKKITLNMNGKKLIGSVNLIFIRETGDLTINGDGLIYSNSKSDSYNGAIKMHGSGNAKLTINGNECNSMNPEEYQSGLLIYADANSSIASYGVKSQPDIQAELNINGGCYSGENRVIAVFGNTKANISNAKVFANSNGIVVTDTSSITSTNNDVTSLNDYAFIINGTSTANIEGGKYVSKAGGNATVQAQGDSILNIKDAIIRQESTSEYNWAQIGIRNEGTNKINIENVDVKSKGPAVYNNRSGIINIKSGTFESINLAVNSGIVTNNAVEGATINICGGTFKTEVKNAYDLFLTVNESMDSIGFYTKYRSTGINWINGNEPTKYGLENHFIVDDNLTCE